MLMLGADGCVEAYKPPDIGCCPPPMCGNDLCCTFVAFFNLLPSGPMWDRWKQIAISYFERNEDPAQCPLIANPECPSLILHAIYTVLKLRGMVNGALWPAVRESNVYTAVTTLDDHLARLQWEDCYNQHCRSVLLGEITPMEVWTDCGPLFCPPTFTEDLQLALKRGIAIALTRANMGVIKNLCGINWIIEPLGAEIVQEFNPIAAPLLSVPGSLNVPAIQPYDAASGETPPTQVIAPPIDCSPDNGCGNAKFKIRRTRDWLEGVGSGDLCDTLTPRPHVPADGGRGCDRPAGLPDQIWPGVLAAECIARSMLPITCPPNISREC